MASKTEIGLFLNELSIKIKIYDILFLDDRGKNQQTLHDLEITPNKRKESISNLKSEDYCQGPLTEEMRGIAPMWVFGKTIKNKEIYIKISLGRENSNIICISFHISEHDLVYPYKN